MKQFFLAVFVCLLATACTKFQSVETPIEGSNLATYTVQDSKLVGIKVNGEQVNITEAIYVKVESHYGRLIAQRSGAPVKWDVFDTEGNKITDVSYDTVVFSPEYYVLTNADGKYFLPSGAIEVIGPKQDFYYRPNLLFVQNEDKWGIYDVTGEDYDAINVVKQKDSDVYQLLVKKDNKYQLLDSTGKVVKKLVSKPAVDRLRSIAGKNADLAWGNDTIGGVVVPNLKTAIK